jgi:hypothetical protein
MPYVVCLLLNWVKLILHPSESVGNLQQVSQLLLEPPAPINHTIQIHRVNFIRNAPWDPLRQVLYVAEIF